MIVSAVEQRAVGVVTRRPFHSRPERPKSVAPADTILAIVVQRTLHRSPHQAFRSLDIHVHQGVVTLRGCVGSYYQKQTVQRLIAELPECRRVVNAANVG